MIEKSLIEDADISRIIRPVFIQEELGVVLELKNWTIRRARCIISPLTYTIGSGESIAFSQNGYLTEGKNYERRNYKYEVYNMAVFCGYLFQNRRRTRHSGYYRLQCHGGYCHHRM